VSDLIKQAIEAAFSVAQEKSGYDPHDKAGKPFFAAEVFWSLEIDFAEFNKGYQFVVETPFGKVDYYPTTEKWIIRKSRESRLGLKSLCREILKQEEPKQDVETDCSLDPDTEIPDLSKYERLGDDEET
jgi:hypothetical protein